MKRSSPLFGERDVLKRVVVCHLNRVIRWIEIVINRIARTASWIGIEVPIDCISFRLFNKVDEVVEEPPYASTPGF